jgi:cytochrome c oxidase subunit 4
MAEVTGAEHHHAGATHSPHEIVAADHEQAHPDVGEYVKIAVVLAVVTLLEVALFYMDFIPNTIVILALLLLAGIKFTLVVLWFMHLKFDSPLFTRLFVTGLILAITVFLIVLLTFGLLL